MLFSVSHRIPGAAQNKGNGQDRPKQLRQPEDADAAACFLHFPLQFQQANLRLLRIVANGLELLLQGIAFLQLQQRGIPDQFLVVIFLFRLFP